ncbi:MAG: C40 family peptidase [Elainellaceae cyanobacterium]
MAFPSTWSKQKHYVCQTPLNIYVSPALGELATQAAVGRQLRILSPLPENAEALVTAETAAVEVLLQEDDYPGWIAGDALEQLQPADQPYQPHSIDRTEISDRIPDVIGFAKAAMAQPNVYRWGGSLGPDYDCSGLVQAAFASVGVWLPRDSYQQEAFTQPVAFDGLQPGDLIFFGTERTTHVALSRGSDRYIHSSGKQQGRNGIGIDVLSTTVDEVSRIYFQQRRSAGRVMQNYQAKGVPFQC